MTCSTIDSKDAGLVMLFQDKSRYNQAYSFFENVLKSNVVSKLMMRDNLAQSNMLQTKSSGIPFEDHDAEKIARMQTSVPLEFQSLKKSELSTDALSDTVNVDFFLLINKYEKYFNVQTSKLLK